MQPLCFLPALSKTEVRFWVGMEALKQDHGRHVSTDPKAQRLPKAFPTTAWGPGATCVPGAQPARKKAQRAHCRHPGTCLSSRGNTAPPGEAMRFPKHTASYLYEFAPLARPAVDSGKDRETLQSSTPGGRRLLMLTERK